MFIEEWCESLKTEETMQSWKDVLIATAVVVLVFFGGTQLHNQSLKLEKEAAQTPFAELSDEWLVWEVTVCVKLINKGEIVPPGGISMDWLASDDVNRGYVVLVCESWGYCCGRMDAGLSMYNQGVARARPLVDVEELWFIDPNNNEGNPRNLVTEVGMGNDGAVAVRGYPDRGWYNVSTARAGADVQPGLLRIHPRRR